MLGLSPSPSASHPIPAEAFASPHLEAVATRTPTVRPFMGQVAVAFHVHPFWYPVSYIATTFSGGLVAWMLWHGARM